MFFELLEFKFEKNGRVCVSVWRNVRAHSNKVLVNNVSGMNLDRNLVLMVIGRESFGWEYGNSLK